MYRTRLIKSVSTIFLLSLFIIPSHAKEIYKWVDKDGILHFTDDPAKVPEDEKGKIEVVERKEKNPDGKGEFDVIEISPPPSEEKSPEADLEKEEQNEEAIRELWRSRALEIETKEKTILDEIEDTEQKIAYKKREVDSLLINGYFADHSIQELIYLNDYLKDLKDQLNLTEQEKENLKEEARRQGIPPGYLRP